MLFPSFSMIFIVKSLLSCFLWFIHCYQIEVIHCGLFFIEESFSNFSIAAHFVSLFSATALEVLAFAEEQRLLNLTCVFNGPSISWFGWSQQS